MDKIRTVLMITQVLVVTEKKCESMKNFVLEITSLSKGDKHGNVCHYCGTPYAIEVNGTCHSSAKTTYPFVLLIVARCHSLCIQL